MLNRLFRLLLLPLLLFFLTACGDSTPTETTQQEPTVEIDPVAQASLANTTDDIRAKLEKQSFSHNSEAAAPSYVAAAGSAEYSMADVIFTIGSDDLSDEAGNTMEKNGAYNWFKLNVADTGKLSEDELAEFNAATPEQFNEAFVESYYAEASKIVETDNPNPASLLYGSAATVSAYGINKAPKRIFGFFFTMFNPMTYMNMMINVVKTVMTWALAQMFKMMLLSGTMTKIMLRLSINFPILTSIMIHVLSEYWGITLRMVPYLKYDTEFGELFAQLAYEQPAMAHFFFQNIDAPLYDGLTVAMTRSKETTDRMAIMMNWYATDYLAIPSQANRYDAFTTLLFDTGAIVSRDENGTVTGHGDRNELYNERFFFALFQSSLGTEQFIKAMQQVDNETLIGFMDHIFLGEQDNDVFGAKVDPEQGYFNIFAIAQGMLSGIEKEGFQAYLQNFIDFAFLIPPERYLHTVTLLVWQDIPTMSRAFQKVKHHQCFHLCRH